MTIAQLPPPPDDDDAQGGAWQHGSRRLAGHRGGDHSPGIKPAPRVSFLTRLKLVPAVFGGYDLRVLARTPSEWTFANLLGSAVLLVSSMSAMSALLTISYAVQVPISRIWWLGVIWLLGMSLVLERLMLQISSSPSRWGLASALSYRLAMLGVIGVIISEPAVLFVNRGEISNLISSQQTSALIATQTRIGDHYDALINADNSQITAIQNKETALRVKAERYKFLSQCEAGAPGCSHTHEIGEGVWYHHYARVAADTKAQLKADKPQDRATIARLRADIQTQQHNEASALGSRTTGINGDGGFLARLEALGTLEVHHPILTWEAWLIRAWSWLWDLLPLASAVLRTLNVKDSPYRALCLAERRRDALSAKQLETDCEVEEDRITRQGRANRDVNRVDVSDWLDGVMSDAGDPYESVDSVREEDAVSEPVDAWDLSTFADNMTEHEKRPVTVPHGLRRAGVVAAFAALGTVLATGVWSLISGAVVSGTWLALAAVVAVAGLASVTRGFRTAPPWAARAIFGSLLASFLLPIAVIGLNVI